MHRIASLRSEVPWAALVFVLVAVLPAVAPDYVVFILPQYLLYGVAAMALGLIWGYGGILSFGQAAFFGLGGYAMAMALKEFEAFNPGYAGLLLAPVAGGILAAVLGWFLFSARVRESYFVIITLAVSVIFEQLAISQSHLTGGFNGMYVDRIRLTFFGQEFVDLYENGPMFYAVLIFTVGAYAVARWAVNSQWGHVLVAIRENETRTESFGFNTATYKTGAFSLAAALTAAAGALYATHAQFVAPPLFGVGLSTQIIIWTAVGGRSTLLGTFLGGVLVSVASERLSKVFPTYWQLLIGIIFVLLVLLFRASRSGRLSRWIPTARWAAWRSAPLADKPHG
jgi:urea ABC transporter permease protein UrtC